MQSRKEKILIITFALPYPPKDGGKIAIYSEIEYLRKFFDITVLFEAKSNEMHHIETLKKIWPNVRIEVIERQAEIKPKKSAVAQVRDLTRGIVKKIRPAPIQAAPDPSYWIVEYVVKSVLFLDQTFLKKVEEILRDEYPVIMVEHSIYMSVVNILPKNSVKVFVEIESRFSVVQDMWNTYNRTDIYADYIVESCKRFEYSLMKAYDALILLTEADKQRIEQEVSNKQMLVSPFPVLDRGSDKIDVNAWQPEKLVFLGSENHFPNKDGIKWFVDQILPKLTNRKIKLCITGNWTAETRVAYSNNDQVVFTGFVDDLNELMKNSICIVPIRIGGGGIRSKLLESLSFGVPVVTTALGASGILAADNKDILIRDGEAEFAAAIDWLVNNPDSAREIIRNGLRIIETHYTYTITGEQKRQFLQKAISEYYKVVS